MAIHSTLRITVCAAGILVSACAHRVVLSPDFGVAVRQDLAAQVADPDAHYTGMPAPGANGSRAALAQTRYQRNDVIQPATTGASTIGAAQGMGGGEGVGAGVGTAAPAATP